MSQFQVTSSAFVHEGDIPSKYTCQGADVTVPLQWVGRPKGTQSLVLIVDDPDAPDPKAPQRTWVHWVLYNLPLDTSELVENIQELPVETREGLNDWKRTGYGGPCPPIGRHRYYHKLYALDVVLPDLRTPNKADLEKAMKGHILETAVLMGTYEKK